MSTIEIIDNFREEEDKYFFFFFNKLVTFFAIPLKIIALNFHKYVYGIV